MELEKLRRKARKVLRRRWMQHALKDVTNNDNHAGLERIYRITDPWNLDSPLEHARFETTNHLILKHFGRVGDLLELGSSEGVQSTYLRRLCRNLYGIDVSPTAVERARKRVPDADFRAGELSKQPWLKEGKRFDLVVACEVLYYVADVRRTLEMMNQLGNGCFVSFFAPEAHKLTALVESIPRVQKGWFNQDGVTWLMAWWENRPGTLIDRRADTASRVDVSESLAP
jgi:trans-aconitate methyltransferase